MTLALGDTSPVGRRNQPGRASAEAVFPNPAALSASTGGRAGEEEGLESERNMPSSHAKSPQTFQLLDYRGALIYSE